jgi:putative acetyltransferase
MPAEIISQEETEEMNLPVPKPANQRRASCAPRNEADQFGQMRTLGRFQLRRATNRDAAGIWNLISVVLSSFDIVADPETTDRDLADIEGCYWDLGGAFFVLVDRETVIGTVALRRESDEVCELCRMYVSADYRRLGLGRGLFETGMIEARSRGFREVFLKTSSVLTTAISLYERAGFRLLPGAKACGNCNLVMSMKLP